MSARDDLIKKRVVMALQPEEDKDAEWYYYDKKLEGQLEGFDLATKEIRKWLVRKRFPEKNYPLFYKDFDDEFGEKE